jgi:hypothetical protein
MEPDDYFPDVDAMYEDRYEWNIFLPIEEWGEGDYEHEDDEDDDDDGSEDLDGLTEWESRRADD